MPGSAKGSQVQILSARPKRPGISQEFPGLLHVWEGQPLQNPSTCAQKGQLSVRRQVFCSVESGKPQDTMIVAVAGLSNDLE